MTEQEILEVRRKLIYEYQRQTFDAFLVGMREMGLSGQDQALFVMEAAVESIHIVWTAYDTVRQSFLDLAKKLLDGYGLSRGEMEDVRKKMYVRFLEGRIRFFEFLEQLEQCPEKPVSVGAADIHNAELAEVFAHLSAGRGEKEFLAELGVRWDYEQLHTITWFAGQLSVGQGKSSRSRPNHSARVTYQQLLNPYSLLWIAAGLGEDPEVIRQAAALAEQRETYKEKSIVIRNMIPFKRIYDLALPLLEKEAETVESARVC